MDSEVAFPLPHRCRRELRRYIFLPSINGIPECLALYRGWDTATTPVDIRHEQIVFSASGTFRHEVEVTNKLTSTLGDNRPVRFLNVPVEQRVRFAVLHLKTSFLIPPLRHWASFPACALVRCAVNNSRCDVLTIQHKRPTLLTFSSC